MNVLYINVCILYRKVYILYIQYIYTLQVLMSTRGIIINFIFCESRVRVVYCQVKHFESS